jgi:hypothetical protein
MRGNNITFGSINFNQILFDERKKKNGLAITNFLLFGMEFEAFFDWVTVLPGKQIIEYYSNSSAKSHQVLGT